MSVVYLDDRWIIRSIGAEIEAILEVNGSDYALSFLQQFVLRPPFSESQKFLGEISRLKSVKKLLSMVSPEEAEPIKGILKGGKNGECRTDIRDSNQGGRNGRGTSS